MFKNQQKYCFFRENKRNNILKYSIFPLIILVLGSFLLAKTAWLSSITEENIINLTNFERQKLGISPLRANQLLTQAAYEKGHAIFNAQKFQHNINGEKFSSWIKKTGYDYDYVGENLAIDFITSEGVIKAWLNSPSHKKNLLNNRFSEIGVSVINGKFDGSDTILVVQIFGAPKFLPNKNIALNNTNGNTDNTLSPITQGQYLNYFKETKPILLNANNSTDEIFKETETNNTVRAGADKQNRTYAINNFLNFINSAINISVFKPLFKFSYLWLLIILFLLLYPLYLYYHKQIYKIKFLFKKQKTQLRLPLK